MRYIIVIAHVAGYSEHISSSGYALWTRSVYCHTHIVPCYIVNLNTYYYGTSMYYDMRELPLYCEDITMLKKLVVFMVQKYLRSDLRASTTG